MKLRSILRLASLIAAAQYALHGFLFLSHWPPHGLGASAQLLPGLDRNLFGYGLMSLLSGGVEVLALWQLATPAAETPSRVRPLIATFVFFNAAHAVIAARYFFPLPAIGDAAVGACLAWAFLARTHQGWPGISSSGD